MRIQDWFSIGMLGGIMLFIVCGFASCVQQMPYRCIDERPVYRLGIPLFGVPDSWGTECYKWEGGHQ